jgi:hypothetical protein
MRKGSSLSCTKRSGESLGCKLGEVKSKAPDEFRKSEILKTSVSLENLK